MLRKRVVASAAVAFVVLLITGACGSSSSSSTSSPKALSTLKGTPIKIGSIGSFSGTQASSEGGAAEVLKAWAQSVNDGGGIAGHPVDLVIKDLGNNVTGGLAAAKELVQREKVVAIVGEQDNADTTWASYIASTGVPVIGGLPINIPFATNADFFPAGTNAFALLYGELALAKQVGSKFGFLYCAEAPQCASSVPLVKGIASAIGVQVPVTSKVSATAPDYTGVCQQLKDAGVQSYSIADASVVVVRVSQACSRLGLRAKPLSDDGTPSPPWAREPSLDGALIAEAALPFTDTTTPGGKAYQALLARYLPELDDSNGPASLYAFAAGRLFEKAARSAATAGSGITAGSLKTALYGLRGETLDGLTPPLTFTQGKATLVNCYFTMGIDGGKFTQPNGSKTTCAPDALVAGIVSQIGKS